MNWPLEQPAACCAAEPSDGLMSCFVEDKGLSAMSRCLDPFLVLDPLNTSRPPSVPAQIERCESLCRDPEFACLHLQAKDQLLRISHIPFGARYQRNEIMLWRGPASEIWNHGAPAYPNVGRINADVRQSGSWRLPAKKRACSLVWPYPRAVVFQVHQYANDIRCYSFVFADTCR